jgi:hypothetical protein
MGGGLGVVVLGKLIGAARRLHRILCDVHVVPIAIEHTVVEAAVTNWSL